MFVQIQRPPRPQPQNQTKPSHTRITNDIDCLDDENFINFCRAHPTDYTRHRKLPFKSVFLSLLTRLGRSLALEIRDWGQSGLIGQGGISVVGYLKQRLKLNPLAFLGLAQYHATQYYTDDQAVATYRGYLLLAVDGSKINVPATKQTIALYGNTSGKGRAQPIIGMSCLVDVINRQIIDVNLTRGAFNERGQIPGHVDAANHIVGNRPYILIADRGYPSIPGLAGLIDQNIPFVIRTSKTYLSTQFAAMTSNDQDATIELARDYRSRLRRKNPDVYQRLTQEPLTLRLIKIQYENQEKYLITSLPRDRFTTSDIDDIYQARWGIETMFKVMKTNLQVENFTSKTPVLIEQDIYATIYLINVIFDLAQQAEQDRAATIDPNQPPPAHTMTININYETGVIKEELIHYVLAPANQKSTIINSILTEIGQHLEPIRPGRSNPRNLEPRANRYSQNHKRAF